MWNTREFETREQMQAFMYRNRNRHQMTEIFINNGYCVEFKPLKKIEQEADDD